jgi:carboxyl-terminal processing protease
LLTAGIFLPKEQVVMLERTKESEASLTPEEFGAGDPIVSDIPMVVLANAGSASASEIVAGALQDLGRAVLIGEKTFGKGSVQAVHELSNGAELRVTKARWYTPNDRAIHGEGLDPDIVVELTQEDAEADLDPQLERAVEYLLMGE